MENGGPSAILGPLERLGQSRVRDGKGRSAKGQTQRGSPESQVTEESDKKMSKEEQDSQGNIDIRV
jgi:hypothetical protein